MPYCPECGKTVSPHAKFCRNCGASQLDETPVPVVSPVPVPPEPAACASCRAPLKPDEKFCGSCGQPVHAPVVSPQAPPQPAPQPVPSPGRVCGSCKSPVGPETKFCGNCGQPVNAAAPAPQSRPQPVPVPSPQPAPVAPAAPNEKIVGVIANAKKPKMLGVSWDTYNLVITERRMILAQLTQPMMNAATAEAQAKAKAQGKGFFGVMADQMSAMFQYAVRYETMAPEAIIAETPGNFTLENSQVSVVDLSIKNEDESSGYSEFKMVIKSTGGKFEFRIAEDERYINILKAAYGDKVKMPFGYHKVGALRIKFF
jgi:hypothetical protein